MFVITCFLTSKVLSFSIYFIDSRVGTVVLCYVCVIFINSLFFVNFYVFFFLKSLAFVVGLLSSREIWVAVYFQCLLFFFVGVNWLVDNYVVSY